MTASGNDEQDADMERLESACDRLMEHFDTIQIFATRHEPSDGTRNAAWGAGNWFARYGQVQEWLTKKSEETRVSVRQESEE